MKLDAELIEAIDAHYTRDHLQKGFLPHALKFVPQLKEIFSASQYAKLQTNKSLTKDVLIMLAAGIFSNKELFLEFKSSLKEEVKQLLGVLVWESYFLHEDMISELYGIRITKVPVTGWRKEKELLREFHLFALEHTYDWHNGEQYYLGVPGAVRKVIADYFDKPEGYYLQALREIPAHFLQFRGEEVIFQELPRLLVYAAQDNIKLTNAGIPVATTYNKMRKALSLREFYDGIGKPYDALRTSLIANLIAESEPVGVAQDGPRILKVLFAYFNQQFYLLHLLQHLKGMGYIDDYYKSFIGNELMGILQEFPQEEGWVSMDNIIKFAGFRSVNLKPASDYYLGRHLYYPIKRRGYVQKEYVSASNYNTLVRVPLLKGVFFLFAAFGLVDAAYEQPEEKDPEENFVTPYDSLCYVRLTPLGAFVSGRTKEYDPPHSAEKTEIQLLGDSLHILSDKPDKTVDMLLENYTVKAGSSRYRTDFQIFMKGVRNREELEAKIRLFRQTVADTLPPNWEAFFETLRLKCDPLKSIGAHSAYQLSQQDQELVKLVARDSVLKKLVIKAEGLIILVMKKDQARFKSRLKEFGYLLE